MHERNNAYICLSSKLNNDFKFRFSKPISTQSIMELSEKTEKNKETLLREQVDIVLNELAERKAREKAAGASRSDSSASPAPSSSSDSGAGGWWPWRRPRGTSAAPPNATAQSQQEVQGSGTQPISARLAESSAAEERELELTQGVTEMLLRARGPPPPGRGPGGPGPGDRRGF